MQNTQRKKWYIRTIALMLCVLLTAGVLPVQASVSGGAETDSIIYNGSFDLSYTNNQTVSGWNLNTGNTNHKTIIQKDVVYGNSGNALKIVATGRSYIWANDVSVESGGVYVLSYWVRVDEAQSLQFAPFLNDSNYSGGWWLDFATTPVTSVTDGWVKVTGTVTIPESVGANTKNPQSKIQLGFLVYQGSGTIYLDQVSMVKTKINLDDPNLHFENKTSGAPANWKTTAQGTTVSAASDVYHDGSSAMYVEKSSLAERAYVNSVVHQPVTANNIYEFSFWMCSQNASPTATVRMELMPYGADGNPILREDGSQAIVYGTTAALNGGNSRSAWEKVVTRAQMPENTAYVTMRFQITRGDCQLWLDDIFFRIVENGTDCVVYYEDFHAVDEKGNISTWKQQGSGSFTAENGGKLTVNGEGYITTDLTCLLKNNTYCIKGNYTADIGGTAQIRFYDQNRQELTQARKTVALQASSTTFSLNVTAPSHTYGAIFVGSDQSGSITLHNVAVYLTEKAPDPNRNYLDADWTARADRENVVSSVEVYNGIPTLMIDGQPTASHFYLRPDLNAYLQTDAESRIQESGIDLFVTYGGSLYKGGCDPIWLADGTIDYAAFDAVIYDTLAASPDALVMVNFGMFAPHWWLEQNPGHEATAHNGSQYIPLGDVSLGSEKFRQEAGEVLRSLIRHMKEQNYYNRVFGLKISGGQSYEWFCWGTGSDQGPDYSEASQEGFRSYLLKKYETVENLRSAWGDQTVTFETATAPGWDERCDFSNVYMGSLTNFSRKMVDWNLWLNEASADSFLYYCQIAKEETDRQLIVGGYNGYLWTSNTYDSQGMAHTAMDRVLDSEYVDWIASPINYNERLLGQSSTYMALLDTVQAHGKLYIAEQDNRTCLAESYAGTSWNGNWDFQVGQTHTMEETLYQQKRDFANAIVNGAGLWQFDMYGGWLDDDALYRYFREAKQEYDISVHLDRNVTNEIAVFVGDESYAYLTAENGNMAFKLLEPMLLQQRKHLAAMGAGYDTYAMSSLLEGKVPPHKLNIILSPFEITPEMQIAIDTYLKTGDQVVVWVYLPGISDGSQMSLSNVERTTGFSISAMEVKSTLQVTLKDSGHPLTQGISGLSYGASATLGISPLPYVGNTENTTVLGYLSGGVLPGLAVKDMGDWTSVYSAAPCLDVSLLRKLMEYAGCHSYNSSNENVIYSSNCYVALHSAVGGEKTVSLPGYYSVYDVFEGKFISLNTNQFTYTHQGKDTHIFRLMKPDTYAVTARIEKGKGTLSQPGLRETIAGESYSLTVTPDFGYAIESVTVNGSQVACDGTLTFSGISQNMDIAVSFRKINWLVNGDFESGLLDGSLSGTATTTTDSTVHSGVYSLRLNHDGTARDLVKMNVFLNPAKVDRQITVTFWARTIAGATTRTVNTAGYCFTADYGSPKTQYGAQYPGQDYQWREYTQTYTLPAGYSIFEFLLYTGESGTDVYIDDISISCDGQQMLRNGGFERGNLTGNIIETENTPELNRATLVRSGSYSGKVSGTGKLTATVEGLSAGNTLQFSGWLQAARSYANTMKCRIVSGSQVLYEEILTLTADGSWQEKTAELVIPAGVEKVEIQLSAVKTSGLFYLDDMQVKILPPKEPEKTELSFQEVFSDGTWRFVADRMELFPSGYYKLPVIIDGVEKEVVMHSVSNLLCIYPNFFGVYGGSVPTGTLVIPEGVLVKKVDPALQWGEVEGAAPVRSKAYVTVILPHVKMWNLSLGGDLTVKFHVQVPEDAVSQGSVRLQVAETTHTEILSNLPYDAETDTYAVSFSLAAAQMTDAICVEILSGETVAFSENYTIRQYAQYVLGQASMERYHSLVTQMLLYGSAAQNYFGYHTEDLAGQGITGDLTAALPETEEPSQEGEVPGIRFYGASLRYRHQVSLRYYFVVSGNVSDYQVSIAGETCTLKEKDGLYYVESGEICPDALDQTLSVTVRDGSGNTLNVTYSPMHYIVRMAEKGSETLKVLMQALYHYHLAAKALS